MEQPIVSPVRAQPKHNKMNYACEACRSSKIKCQPGPQPGICKRCSEFKRECVFRTGPRTRRPRVARPDVEVQPPPPGPSKTFSIDFTMPASDDGERDEFDELRERHERYIDNLEPSDDDDDAAVLSPSAVGGQQFSFNDMSMPTPSSSNTSSSATKKKNSRPVSSLGIKPQFNLDSAAGLLGSFRSMLPHAPCVVLPEDAGVRSMARDMPFVLLAILAVTSCSASLKSYSLYDEEFRKILGLKFVAGGERSLELLQGLLIYCAWYPFYLRPKNKQLFQYLRMAVDIVQDLELDEDTGVDLAAESPERKESRFQAIRAYLVSFYIFSVHSWGMSRPSSLDYTPWMAKCCDFLEAWSDLEQDKILVWLVRLQYIQHDLFQLRKARQTPNVSGQSEQHRQLLRIGLETQLRDFQARIPGHLSTTPSILLASLNTDTYILAAPLMQAIRPRLEDGADPVVEAARYQAATYTVRAVFDYVTSLPPEQLAYFSGPDLTRLIVFIILAYRLSFPIPGCTGYDYVQGHKVIELGTHLAKLSAISDNSGAVDGVDSAGKDTDDSAKTGKSESTSGSKKIDALTAMRIVLGSVKARFDKKTAEMEAKIEESNKRARGCPMFDGSLDQYLPLWEGQTQQGDISSFLGSSSYATSSYDGGNLTATSVPLETNFTVAGMDGGSLCPLPDATVVSDGSEKPVFHDLWATMTMGWATDMDPAGVGDVDVSQFGVGL